MIHIREFERLVRYCALGLEKTGIRQPPSVMNYGWAVVAGGILLHLSLGDLYTFGNVASYAARACKRLQLLFRYSSFDICVVQVWHSKFAVPVHF